MICVTGKTGGLKEGETYEVLDADIAGFVRIRGSVEWWAQGRFEKIVTQTPVEELGEPRASDPISPAHYARYKIEPITFIMENNLPFAVGNVVKYVCRFDAKNGLEDLKKAKRYVEFLIEQAEKKAA